MTSSSANVDQGNSPTIDGLAGKMELLRARLMSNAKCSSRELRTIWTERLRPFWRLQVELYRPLSRRFLDHGDNYLASEVADEGALFFGDDVALILTRALASARSGAPQAAQDLLARKAGVLADAVEAKSLLARTFKDLWKTSGEEHYLCRSFDLYYLDYTTTKGDRTFPGVNAASMALFLRRSDEAQRIAQDVLGLLRVKSDTANYWDQVTLAECQLVLGHIEPARETYAAAASSGVIPHAHLATTRAQVRLLLRELGKDDNDFDSCFPLPGVIAFTGHRTDAPDRQTPRFPDAQAPVVKERIRSVIAKQQAGFGYAAAASGADILFLEAMQEAGLETYVHLPLPEIEFIRQSVAPEWLERYRSVVAAATELTSASSSSSIAFDYGNRLLFGAASQHARQLGSSLCLLAVWDGQPGDGAGGTADYVHLVREMGRPVEVIDLQGRTRAPAASRHVHAETQDQLLSALSFYFDPEDGTAPLLAPLLERTKIVHREVANGQVRLLFSTPVAAAHAALSIVRCVKGALGLHIGPMHLARHPLTHGDFVRSENVAKADNLAAIEPSGLIYASHAFAALLGLHTLHGLRCEFLGYRALHSDAAPEPIFRLTA